MDEPMPLTEMSANGVDAESRKRNHDEYASDVVAGQDENAQAFKKNALMPMAVPEVLKTPALPQLSSAQNSPVSLTDAGSSTPRGRSPSPNRTPTRLPADGDAIPPKLSAAPTLPPAPAKKSKLTAAELEAKAKEKEALAEARRLKEEARKKEREEKEAAKQVKAQERELAKREKEEQQRKKAEELEEKKRRKEEEERRAREEKERKERSQPKLNMFFGMTTPKKPSGPAASSPSKNAAADPSPAKSAITEYERLFKPFFLKPQTRIAAPPSNQLTAEEWDTRTQYLDAQLASAQANPPTLCLSEIFQAQRKPRGSLQRPSVRQIMAPLLRSDGNSPEAAAVARKELRGTPMRLIKFQENVRPAYNGTVSLGSGARESQQIARAARRPTDRRLPLNYDYDSEAEWQDEEDGEDVDMEDDEEDVDSDDDMEEFLDDSEDVGPAKRVLQNDMEPESTGICFEDHTRKGPHRTPYEFRLEFIVDNLEHTWGIDPFSTQYWASKPAKQDSAATMLPPPVPANAFAAISAADTPAPKIARKELLPKIKRTILENKVLTKVGMGDILYQTHKAQGLTRAEAMNTLDFVAERRGKGRAKEYALRPGHELEDETGSADV